MQQLIKMLKGAFNHVVIALALDGYIDAILRQPGLRPDLNIALLNVIALGQLQLVMIKSAGNHLGCHRFDLNNPMQINVIYFYRVFST